MKPRQAAVDTYPARVRARTERGEAVYVTQPGYRALRGVRDPARLEGVEFTLQRGATVVCRSPAGASKSATNSSPVYARDGGGPLSVPTGRVFVRLPDGQRADARRADFERAGYAIAEVVSYAPQAAWLEPKKGGVAAGLAGVERLLAMEDLRVVEPQMLSPAVRK